jgi:undecaprenyl phosphate-alpha-L-ara4FN deformylase
MAAKCSILGLKVDVCTYEGLRVGVPNLLRLFAERGIRASFFVALGPDTTGRAILRVLRPGFVSKLRRTRAVRTYGLRTLLSGTLLPPRHPVRRLAPVLRSIAAAEHELAVHGYNHQRWQDRLHRMDEPAVREEIGRAMALYREVAGNAPRGFGAPGWQVTPASLRVVDGMGFAYASDTRGRQPFFPRIDEVRLRTLQLPTTFPTLDEVLGREGMQPEDFIGLVCGQMRDAAPGVLTLHAEMEGVNYLAMTDRLLAALREARVTCVPLETLAERICAGDTKTIPTAEVVARPIRGRAGMVAMPAGLEVS